MSEIVGSEVVVSHSDTDINRQLASIDANSDSGIVSTIQGDDFSAKLKTANAVMNAAPLQDQLGKVIELTDWVAQPVQLVNEDDERVSAVRVVIIDAKGSAYSTVSDGVITSLSNLVSVLGHPNGWDAPVKVSPAREMGRHGFHYLTLKLA